MDYERQSGQNLFNLDFLNFYFVIAEHNCRNFFEKLNMNMFFSNNYNFYHNFWLNFSCNFRDKTFVEYVKADEFLKLKLTEIINHFEAFLTKNLSSKRILFLTLRGI